MSRFAKILRRARADRRGATAIEYGLIAALIFLVMLVGAGSLSEANKAMWDKVGTEVGDALK